MHDTTEETGDITITSVKLRLMKQMNECKTTEEMGEMSNSSVNNAV